MKKQPKWTEAKEEITIIWLNGNREQVDGGITRERQQKEAQEKQKLNFIVNEK